LQAQGYDGRLQPADGLHQGTGATSEGQAGAAKAFVPLSFELGEAFQFDWSEEGLVIGGMYHRVQVAHMKLCASRGRSGWWPIRARATRCCSMRTPAASRRWAVSPRAGIYDNMKTAVDEVKKGKGRHRQCALCGACARHYLFDPDFCNVASGWEKGVVEKNVQDSRRRIWIEARSSASAASLSSTPGWLSAAVPCRQRSRIPSTSSSAWPRCWSCERAHLMPMPAPFDGYVEKSGAGVAAPAW
jgi:hypothetical protein